MIYTYIFYIIYYIEIEYIEIDIEIDRLPRLVHAKDSSACCCLEPLVAKGGMIYS